MKIASLSMYDWPEVAIQTAAFWAQIRDGARAEMPAIDLPNDLTPLHGNDPMRLWHNPVLVFSQTCWGPLSLGLIDQLLPLAQPDYSGFEGGRGPFYRSALVARRDPEIPAQMAVPNGPGGTATPELLAGRRFAFNGRDSLSGILGLHQDLGQDPCKVAASHLETGSHRASIIAVAQGRADLAAIDCRSWALARRVEPCVAQLVVVGWTSERLGLPYVTHRATDAETAQTLRKILIKMGCHPAPEGGKQ